MLELFEAKEDHFRTREREDEGGQCGGKTQDSDT